MYYLKVSKMTSFVSKNLRIYWFRVTNNFISGRYCKNNVRSPNLIQKSKRFDIQLKNGTLFVRKANVFLMTSSKHEKRFYVKSNFSIKSTMYIKYFCQVSIGLSKRWRNDSYVKEALFGTFYTQQRKDDVIVTSLSIWSGFSLSQNIHLIPTWFCTEFE